VLESLNSSESELFDAFERGHRPDLTERLADRVTLVAGPWRSVGETAAGDLMLRVRTGEGQASLAVLADGVLLDLDTARKHGWLTEGELPGRYALVLEDAPPSWAVGEPWARRIADANGFSPAGQALLRLEPAARAGGPAAEDTRASTDYADVVQFVQAKFYRSMPSGRTINRVVIHITDGGPSAKNTASYFADPKNKNGKPVVVSAHYIVGQAGEIYQSVREKDLAWHAGLANTDSIGIEHNARSAHELDKTDPGLPLTQVQYAASAALVKDICSRYNIPLDRAHIIGHNEADPKNPHPDCPTGQWDWTYFMNLLSGPVLSAPRAETLGVWPPGPRERSAFDRSAELIYR
jgi:N-acetyl-anhydromuramyl-L-alanine amidase AmpD